MLRQWYDRLLARLHVTGRDVAVFAMSLLLASSIWLSYTIDQDYSEVLRVPVVAESNIPGRYPTSSNISMIEARCRTSGYRIMHLHRQENKKPLTVHFDPAVFDRRAGDEFFVSSSDLAGYVTAIFGDDVILEGFATNGFSFVFPVENHKKVKVQPVSLITYKSQFMSKDGLQVAPDSVIVYGEPQYLEGIDKIQTELIQMSNVSSSKSGAVKFDVPKGLRLSESAAAYSLDVTRYVEVTKTVKVAVRNVPSGRSLSVYPSSAEVAFRCAFPMTSDRTDEVTVYVDYEDFAGSINGRCIAKWSSLPAGVIGCTVTPEIFECIENR